MAGKTRPFAFTLNAALLLIALWALRPVLWFAIVELEFVYTIWSDYLSLFLMIFRKFILTILILANVIVLCFALLHDLWFLVRKPT